MRDIILENEGVPDNEHNLFTNEIPDEAFSVR
jgi:hypothetical protein